MPECVCYITIYKRIPRRLNFFPAYHTVYFTINISLFLSSLVFFFFFIFLFSCYCLSSASNSWNVKVIWNYIFISLFLNVCNLPLLSNKNAWWSICFFLSSILIYSILYTHFWIFIYLNKLELILAEIYFDWNIRWDILSQRIMHMCVYLCFSVEYFVK